MVTRRGHNWEITISVGAIILAERYGPEDNVPAFLNALDDAVSDYRSCFILDVNLKDNTNVDSILERISTYTNF